MAWDIPKWDNPGQSPPEQKKTDGWAVGDKPPADWLNWFMNKTSENLTEAKTGIETNTAQLADKASKVDVNNLKTDYEYQTPIIVGDQIQVTKLSDTNIVKFKLTADITATTAFTISTDGGATSKPLVDVDGVVITELEKGFVEVVEDGVNFTLRPRGRAIEILGQDVLEAKYMESIEKGSPVKISYMADVDYPFSDIVITPDVSPSNIGYGLAFSPDGNYMAVASSATPYIIIYKRDGDVFTKLSNPGTLPAGSGKGIAFSPDGTYLTIAHSSTPYITIYKRDGDVFTRLSNPGNLPTGASYGVAFSPDGKYMGVVHEISPRITIYKRDGDVFTKLADSSVLPTGVANGLAFSPDGNYMAVAHSISPFITIYKRDGDIFAKLPDPTTLPPAACYGVAFSPDGMYMSVAHTGSPYITIYKRDGDIFTKLANPSILPGGNALSVAFSSDGKYMAVGHGGTPYITVYKREGDVFTKLANPSVLPTGVANGLVFSPDVFYLGVAHTGSPYITIYKTSFQQSNYLTYISTNVLNSVYNSPMGAFRGIGYAKQSGVLNDKKEIVRLWRDV